MTTWYASSLVTWQRWRSHHWIRHGRNPLLYANFTALSSIRPTLSPIKVFHCVNRNFGYLWRNVVENIKYFIRTAKLIKMMPKHIFWPIIDCFSMYVTGVTRIQGVVSLRSSPNRCVWSLPFTWQRWRSHNSIRHFWKPHAICKLHDSIFYRSGLSYCQLKFYIAGIRNFAFFCEI